MYQVTLEFLQEKCQERVQLATAIPKKNVNNLHAELGHPFEVITHATAKSMDIHVTGTFKPYKGCVLGKVKKGRVSMTAIVCSEILREWLFFDINLPYLPTFESEKQLS